MLDKEPLATEVDFGAFTMDRSHDSQNFDLAGLKPCRFVAASESNKYSSLNAARVKAITGGNEIRAAFKRRDHFTYRPQFKVWLSSNYPVNADVDDDAIWYRLKVIQFPNSYAGREDKNLKRQLRQEKNMKAVLTWAVKGAIRWYNQEGTGLRTPKKVVEATEQARLELDYVGQWLEEHVEQVQTGIHFVPNSALYLSYQEWCKENGVTPKHKRSLTMELKRKGIDAGQQRKVGGIKQRGCFGIKLL
jgi:putative DNA primase/helicase